MQESKNPSPASLQPAPDDTGHDHEKVALIVADADGTILSASPGTEWFTGDKPTGSVGQSVHELVASLQASSAYSEARKTIGAGRAWHGHCRVKRPDGTPRAVDMIVTPTFDETGESIHHTIFLQDVTGKLQQETQIRQTQKMEALGRLAGGIAHDFNNLLTIIHLSLRLLERQMYPEDPLWEHMQRIREASERASTLTRQLLSFSRREITEAQFLDLNLVVGSMSRMLQRVLGEDVRLLTVLDTDLWPLEMDPSQLDQIIINLALNARDAMPDGGSLTIETSNIVLDDKHVSTHVGAAPGRHVRLAFRDTGVGVDDEMKDYLFEPFFTTKQEGRGSGLGLSTVFGIVTQYRGLIRVDSRLGQGATFEVLLPAASDRGARPAPDLPPPVAPVLVRGEETVLVVEDEQAIRNLAASVLKSCGYQVLTADGGDAALQTSTQHNGPIHLLLTDLVMPEMHGLELAELLRRERPEMRVLYVSGRANRKALQEHASRPDTFFMPKPFTIQELTEKVRTVLDGRA
jgi:PAS domain S-box-containing protein